MYFFSVNLDSHNFITNKRLMRVRELKSEGMNNSQAASLAGFGNYSSFYRAYQKTYGYAPSDNKMKVEN